MRYLFPGVFVLLSVFSVSPPALPAPVAIVYVDADAAGAMDGSSWENAYTSLQAALVAATSDQEIRVAQGVYTPSPGNQEASFQLKSRVAVLGGFAGVDQPNPDARDLKIYKTILSGGLSKYHVVTASGADSSAGLDGFTITRGKAFGMQDHSHGGGLFNRGGNPTIRNCIFQENSSSSHGGGLYNESGSPTLFNCTFVENTAGFSGGGGIYSDSGNPNLINCTFLRNRGNSGGGGGMRIESGSPTLTNCRFLGNTGGDENGYSSSGGGGGMYNANSNPLLINCLFSGNSTGNNRGGAMRNFSQSSPQLINCTFAGNSASNSQGGGIFNDSGNPTLTNCILWGNWDKDGHDASSQIQGGSPSVTYSCIQDIDPDDADIPFEGRNRTIDDDPLFFDPDGFDNLPGTEDDNLRLRPGSPCADSSDNEAIPFEIAIDLDGRTRFADDPTTPDTGHGTIPYADRGAYEGPHQGFLLSSKDITVPEEGTASFTVALAQNPQEEVQVTIAWNSGDPDLTVESGGSLTFQSHNYGEPQTVTLKASADADAFCGTAAFSVSAPGLIPEKITATEGDNEPFPPVFYVDAIGGDDSNDGLSPDTAFATIQKGIDTTKNGDTVVVADGAYSNDGQEGNKPVVDFRGKAITVRSAKGPENCTLSKGSSVVVFQNGETAEAVLSGFTIRGGDPSSGISCTDSSPTITNCIITKNWSEYGLGAVFLHNSSAILLCNLICNNAAEEPSAGIYCCHNSSPSVINCTISGNQPGGIYCDDSSSAAVSNCILWGNGEYDLQGCSATYSCLERLVPGEGNIDDNPLFVDPEDGDYHLKSGSPAIDAGTQEGAPSMDMENRQRPCGDGVDMGAYEWGDCSTPFRQFQRGDTNSDGQLDITDAIHTLFYLFGDGSASTCLDAADANDDGTLDLADIIETLGHLFVNGGPLAEPLYHCGEDWTLDPLTCYQYKPCE